MPSEADITLTASDDEIAKLRSMFTTFENGQLHAKLDEYSEVNIEFHQTIIRMSANSVLISLAENLFTHMRMIRRKTIGEKDAGRRRRLFGVNRTRGFARSWRTWRRSTWKYWAGVVTLQTWMFSSAHSWR